MSETLSRVRTSLGLDYETGDLTCYVHSTRQFSSSADSVLYAVGLLNLTDAERNLNAGRFQHFTLAPQDHYIRLPMISRERLTETVDWIAAHQQGVWSLHVHPNNVSDVQISFSFADQMEAAHFALYWR